MSTSRFLALAFALPLCLRAPVAAQVVTAQFRVNTMTTGVAGRPSIARQGTDSYVVVWVAPDGDQLGIYGRRLTLSGAPIGAEFRVNADTAGDIENPSVDTDADGNGLINVNDIFYLINYLFAGGPDPALPPPL